MNVYIENERIITFPLLGNHIYEHVHREQEDYNLSNTGEAYSWRSLPGQKSLCFQNLRGHVHEHILIERMRGLKLL